MGLKGAQASQQASRKCKQDQHLVDMSYIAVLQQIKTTILCIEQSFFTYFSSVHKLKIDARNNFCSSLYFPFHGKLGGTRCNSVHHSLCKLQPFSISAYKFFLIVAEQTDCSFTVTCRGVAPKVIGTQN